MEYSKYHMNYYRIHMVKTDKFKTIRVNINFKRKVVEEEITLRRFLSYMLLNSCQKFKTERQLNMEIENLYNIGIRSGVSRSGKYSILSFSMNLLNEKYTEEGMIQHSFEFIKELLFSPNIVENRFEQSSFDLVKKAIQEEIEGFQDSPNRYSRYRLCEETSKDSILSYPYMGTLEQLEKITPENLYEYYQSVIQKDMLDIFIIGEIDELKVKQIIDQMIPSTDRMIETDRHYLKCLEPKEEKQIVEPGNYNQSKLAISLRLDPITDFEGEYVLQIFNFIFGGGSESKLFQEVREKNSLCYSISASSMLLDRLIIVQAGIDGNTFEKTVSLIKKCLQDMKDGKFTKKDIDKAKMIYQSGCQEMLDSPDSILNNFISKEYLNTDLIEDKMKNVKKVNKDMLMKLGEKIHIDTIYLLKGGLENEENTSN